MDSKQNNKIKVFWGQSFPKLKDNEALIESVFTIPEYRGKGIMPSAIDSISEKGKDFGIKYLMLFVEIDNVPSLKGCHRSGFSPYVLRTEKWILFKRSIRFEEVSKDVMDRYLKSVMSD
jgi:RimJ/RimL family protein N-acetyltransferase